MNQLKLILSVLICFGVAFLFSEMASAQSYIVNPNQTYTYSKMVKDIKKLEQAYPDLVDAKVIGTSEYGRNIYAVALGKGDATVFINGSHHAREWITTTVNMNMIDKYANAYEKGSKINGYDAKEILNSTTIWFIPMVNPDGVTLQQTGLTSFPKQDHAKLVKMNDGSKNFKRWKANGKGIDLNRQYDARWKYLGGGSIPKFKNYKGKSPESAKETQVVLDFVKDTDPEMAISYHSSGQILFWKYGQTGSRYTRDRTHARKISSMTGYRLISPSGYTGGGGFSDWFSTVEKKPAYTIEVAPYAGETHVPIKYFKKIWQENAAIGLYTAQEGAKLYNTEQLAKSKALTTDIQTFNKTAKTLSAYYFTSVNKTSDLRITNAQTTLYNKTKQEITKQEKAIAKLPKAYQTSANASLRITKLYRDRYLTYQTAVKAGEGLADTHEELINALTKGTLNTKTNSLFTTWKKSKNTTETKISKMYSKKVRTLAQKKYIAPVEKDLPAVTNLMARYTLLTTIDKQADNKEYEAVKEQLVKLEQLNQQATAKEKFKQAEAFLEQWQSEIEQALPVEEPPAEPTEPTPSEETNEDEIAA